MLGFGLCLTCLGWILAGVAIRFPADRSFAAPTTVPDDWYWPLSIGCLVLGGVASVLGLRQRPARHRREALELNVFFAALLLVGWTVLATSHYGRNDAVAFIILGCAAIWLLGRDLREKRTKFGLEGFGASVRWLGPPTLIFALTLFLTRVPRAAEEVSTPIAVAMTSYPLYALIQILVFQTILVRRLERLEVSTAAIVATTAAMFTLVHWPNPLVMAACAGGMSLWTIVYLRRPNLWSIAISMGVTAAALTQWGPVDATHHMRVGPNYVETRQRHRAEAAWDARVDAHANDDYYAAAGSTLEGYVVALYRDALRRPPRPDEIRHWVATIQAQYRAFVVRQFHNSPEYLRNNPELPLLELPRIDFLRRDFVPPETGFDELDELISPSFYASTGGTFHPWLRHVYQRVLDRTPNDRDLHSWSATPPARERRRIAAEFLRLGDTMEGSR